MTRVIAFNGSPRQDWNTATLLEKALEGVSSEVIKALIAQRLSPAKEPLYKHHPKDSFHASDRGFIIIFSFVTHA